MPTARPPGRPRGAPVEVQRACILDAARVVFAEHDYHGSTLEKVAREAKVSRPLLYELFGGKDQLFVAVVDDAVVRLLEYFRLADDELATWAKLPTETRVRTMVANLFRFVEERPAEAALLRIAEYGGFGPAKSEVMLGRQRIETLLTTLIHDTWSGAADVSTEASRLLALVILSSVEAVGFRQPSEPAWDQGATIDIMTNIIMGSFRELTDEANLVSTFGNQHIDLTALDDDAS
jgi:AcrR family transcriptional regulator